MNVSHFLKICQLLTILHQLICRGVANFGTQRITVHSIYLPPSMSFNSDDFDELLNHTHSTLWKAGGTYSKQK